jgi:hypothetical protein
MSEYDTREINKNGDKKHPNVIESFKNQHIKNNLIYTKKEPTTDKNQLIENGKGHVKQIIKGFRQKHNVKTPEPITQRPRLIPILVTDTTEITQLEKQQTKMDNIGKTEDNVKQLFLLNFEDDTFKPVVEIEEQYVNIIKDWYSICDQIIDIERTNITIDNSQNIVELSKILFKHISCNFKDEFINNYVPKVLEFASLEKQLKQLETKMSINNKTTFVETQKIKSISDLNIIIPENMKFYEDYFYKNNYKLVIYENKNKNKNSITKIHPEMKRNINVNERLNPELVNTDNCSYECLNFTTDLGFSSVSTNYLCDSDNDSDVLLTNKLIIVLLNPNLLQTLVVVDPSLIILEIIDKYTEYGFIELFTIKTENVDIENIINKQFNTILFNDVEELNEMLKSISQFIEFAKSKQSNTSGLLMEEQSVKTYLKTYFDITDDIGNKMKASALYDTVLSSVMCKINKTKLSGFKNRLSQYLKEIGLQKKRYNDGYYYYGIIYKNQDKSCGYKTNPLNDVQIERQLLFTEMNDNNFYKIITPEITQ